MRKRFSYGVMLICCGVLSATILFFSARPAVTAEPAAVKETLTWDNEKWTLTFNHAKHSEALKQDCLICHHKDEKGKEQKCSGCHPVKLENPEEKKTIFKNAMHKTCKDCHKKEGKGPTTCKLCHIPKEKPAE